MARFNQGWRGLIKKEPIPITEVLSYASIIGSVIRNGYVIDSPSFNTPLNGVWNTSPLSFNTVQSIPINFLNNEDVTIVNAMNMQTQYMNQSLVSPPLRNLIFAYGNDPHDFKFSFDIFFNSTSGIINNLQISILENIATTGDKNGNIEVFEFGNAPFTSGPFTLKLILSGYYGSVNLGIRIDYDSSIPPHPPLIESSILVLRMCILPNNFNELNNQINFLNIMNYLNKNIANIILI
jgi:hypothetical protein